MNLAVNRETRVEANYISPPPPLSLSGRRKSTGNERDGNLTTSYPDSAMFLSLVLKAIQCTIKSETLAMLEYVILLLLHSLQRAPVITGSLGIFRDSTSYCVPKLR